MSGSRLSFTRGVGSFAATAAVVTEKTAEALKALLGDVDFFAKNGLTDAEVVKTRSQARADLVDTFEGVDAATSQLATDAALGLGADFERKAATVRDTAKKPDLDAVAKETFDPSHAVRSSASCNVASRKPKNSRIWPRW